MSKNQREEVLDDGSEERRDGRPALSEETRRFVPISAEGGRASDDATAAATPVASGGGLEGAIMAESEPEGSGEKRPLADQQGDEAFERSLSSGSASEVPRKRRRPPTPVTDLGELKTRSRSKAASADPAGAAAADGAKAASPSPASAGASNRKGPGRPVKRVSTPPPMGGGRADDAAAAGDAAAGAASDAAAGNGGGGNGGGGPAASASAIEGGAAGAAAAAADADAPRPIRRSGGRPRSRQRGGMPSGGGNRGRGGGGAGGGADGGAGRRGSTGSASIMSSMAPKGAGGYKPGRWRAHAMMEDYVNVVGTLMYPKVAVGPFGYDPEASSFPMERPSMLGIVTHQLKRPHVFQEWNPREVAVFEGAIAACGKLFHDISKLVGTKTPKDCIAFYYMWKKTSHYKQWKLLHSQEAAITSGNQQEELLEDSEPEDEEEEEDELGFLSSGGMRRSRGPRRPPAGYGIGST